MIAAIGSGQILIALLGSGGIIGAVGVLFRLGGEHDSMAVTQAAGAVEALAELNKILKDDLAACRKLCSSLQAELARCQDLLAQFETRWGPL